MQSQSNDFRLGEPASTKDEVFFLIVSLSLIRHWLVVTPYLTESISNMMIHSSGTFR